MTQIIAQRLPPHTYPLSSPYTGPQLTPGGDHVPGRQITLAMNILTEHELPFPRPDARNSSRTQR